MPTLYRQYMQMLQRTCPCTPDLCSNIHGADTTTENHGDGNARRNLWGLPAMGTSYS